MVYTTDNKQIINCCYGGLPVIGEHKKPKKELINYKLAPKYYGKGFNTKVGYYTNCSTATYELLKQFEKGTKEYQELIQRLKLYCHFQALQIDSTKGIEVEELPKHWTIRTKITQEMRDTLSKEEIDNIEFNNSLVIRKRPYFMKHLYSNYAQEYKQYIANYDNYYISKFGYGILDMPESIKQTEEYKNFINNFNKYNPLLETNGSMNKVCKHMEQNCKELKNYIKNLKTEDCFELYFNKNIELDKEKVELMEIKFKEYLDYKKKQLLNNSDNSYLSYIKELQSEIYYISSDIRELANLAIYVCYNLYPNKPKDFAWDVCGDGIIENLFENKNNYEISIPTEDVNGDLEYLGKKYSIKTKSLYEEFDYENIDI